MDWNIHSQERYFTPQERYFTKAELAEYSAGSQETLYLSILGQVFDVTKGRRFYGAHLPLQIR
jgi:predicted heme/steroid binding protein